ncbi:MAG: sporulation protein YqfD [Clostridia bacterium]|nr:sporulation protein YqfD [Clostridia bacterium]
MNISYFICGYVTIKANYDNITPLLNLCMYYCIPYSDFRAETDGVLLTMRLSAKKKLEREAKARGIEFETVKKGGIPTLLSRYKHRYGIAMGMLIAAALIFFSHRFVWDIEVTGNESITTSEICEALKNYGLGVGSYIPSLNTDRIENEFLLDSERVSWISVNLIGTVAEVQIREYQGETDEQASTKPANLVASKSGIVQEVKVYNGNVVVVSGQHVNKGELLVSGLYDSQTLGFRYTRAEGSIMAKTVTEYYIEIPYEYEATVYTGAEYCDKYLNFFDYSINISKNSGKEGALYDTISIVESLCLPDGTETPFEMRTVKHLEYESVTLTRTAVEAEELAYFELSQRLATAAEGTTILRKIIVPQIKDGSFALYCTVIAIEDIAKTVEFEVE